MTTRSVKGSLDQKDDDSIISEKMDEIINQLKILNAYMACGFDKEITIEDLDNDD